MSLAFRYSADLPGKVRRFVAVRQRRSALSSTRAHRAPRRSRPDVAARVSRWMCRRAARLVRLRGARRPRRGAARAAARSVWPSPVLWCDYCFSPTRRPSSPPPKPAAAMDPMANAGPEKSGAACGIGSIIIRKRGHRLETGPCWWIRRSSSPPKAAGASDRSRMLDPNGRSRFLVKTRTSTAPAGVARIFGGPVPARGPLLGALVPARTDLGGRLRVNEVLQPGLQSPAEHVGMGEAPLIRCSACGT